MSILQLSKEQVELASDLLRTFDPKLYSTRSGLPAMVFTEKGTGHWPLLGVYHNGEEWIPTKWMEDGRYPSINEKVLKSGLDLIILKVEPELELA